jgi:ELWxxDGT repeat protein
MGKASIAAATLASRALVLAVSSLPLALAGPAARLYDISVTPKAVAPPVLGLGGTAAGPFVYFLRCDDVSGCELWKTDGSEAGTVLVKDIWPGTEDGFGGGGTAVGSRLFFFANDGRHGIQVWTSEGTAADTRGVTRFGVDGGPHGLTNVGGTLFFGHDGMNDAGLWKSDGTEAGTVRVSPVGPFRPYLIPGSAAIVGMNGIAYFGGRGAPLQHNTLWRSDGTSAGTFPVQSSAGHREPAQLTYVNNRIFFVADDGFDGPFGNELWRSDGTASGTEMVRDIRFGRPGSDPLHLTPHNYRVYFSADDGRHGRELWWATQGGSAVMVADINPGAGGSYPENLTSANLLFFTINGALWSTDGTDATTLPVHVEVNGITPSVNPGTHQSPVVDGITVRAVGSLTNFNGTLFFGATDPVRGEELWKSDGTPAGTTIVKDIAFGPANSRPNSLVVLNGVLLFIADDGVSGPALWRSDGTEGGTVMIKTLVSQDSGSHPRGYTAFGGTAFFSADDGLGGREPWSSDGTAAGTRLLRDINTSGSSGPSEFVSAATGLFFSADDGVSGRELWRTDGTHDGTTLVQDIAPGSDSSTPMFLRKLDEETFLFNASTSSFGVQLWRSDGTESGTVMVTADVPWFNPAQLTNVGGTMFFSGASFPSDRQQLWKSDGTGPGTVLVSDGLGHPQGLTAVNGTLFFTAESTAVGSASGRELWKSDGTDQGTAQLKDINPAPYASEAAEIAALTGVAGNLFFAANDGSAGRELWKTDGTEAGTMLVKDIRTGPSSSLLSRVAVRQEEAFWIPPLLADMNGTLLFEANDGNGGALWKSDGTTSGTTLVKEAYLRSALAVPEMGGALLAMDGEEGSGLELWITNGTPEGTVLLQDINPGPLSSTPQEFTRIGDRIFFNAHDGSSGFEPWVLSVKALPGNLAVDAATVSEGNSGSTNLVFTIGLTAPVAHEVTVDFATADGTALVSGRDYQAASGRLIFAPGQRLNTVAITVFGDRKREGNETLFLSLRNATGAFVSQSTGQGVIVNDDH